MSLGERLLKASKKALEVHEEAGSHKRAEAGYARIDPLALADQAGVAVMVKPLERLLGAFVRERQPGILLNSERPIGMVHMTCAHELGHFHMGHLTRSDEHLAYGNQSESVEQEANQFAYSLMAPRWLVTRAMRAKGWSQANLLEADVVYQLSLRLGVSFTGMVWSLNRLKFLPPHVAQALSKQQPKALKVNSLPAGIELPEKSDVWLLDERDKDWVIEPRSTDRFVVRLPSHATAGYLWSAEALAGEGFTLKPITIDARQKPKPVGPPLVGGGAEDLYLLDHSFEDPAKRGRAHANLREVQPWSKTAESQGEVSLAMEFEELRKGLSHATRARAVNGQVGREA